MTARSSRSGSSFQVPQTLWIGRHRLRFSMTGEGPPVLLVNGLGAVVRAQSKLTKVAIAPGALLTVLSGLILTFQLSGGDLAGFSIWLVIMQGAGVIAGLITLLIALPTATRLGRLDPAGEAARYFDELRVRQRIVASIAGTLGLVALFAGAMMN